MRLKTSITLPGDLLEQIDRVEVNRSVFIEKAARRYLAHLAKMRREARDTAIMEAHAARLNREALDVLEYQDLSRRKCSAANSTW